jgi:hypothetical protein
MPHGIVGERAKKTQRTAHQPHTTNGIEEIIASLSLSAIIVVIITLSIISIDIYKIL